MFANDRVGAQGGASVQGDAGAWAADPHQWGAGKIHLVDAEDVKRTMCGKWLEATPGKPTKSDRANCKICVNAVLNRADRARQNAEYQRQVAIREAERAEQSREWWDRYNAYLRSPQWAARRAKVMKRAGGICEACLERKATEVHHDTYRYRFNEPCFDLRAVCHPCHEQITELDRQRRENSLRPIGMVSP